jgi:hypothetical protein
MEEEGGKQRRKGEQEGIITRQNRKAPSQRSIHGATVTDDVIMEGTDELPLCSMTKDDATATPKYLALILRIYVLNP